MNQVARQVQEEAALIEQRSRHDFPVYPSRIVTGHGDVWYLDCLRCGRSVMLLPNAEHTIGAATTAEWCKLTEDSTPPSIPEEGNSADKGD